MSFHLEGPNSKEGNGICVSLRLDFSAGPLFMETGFKRAQIEPNDSCQLQQHFLMTQTGWSSW